MAVTIDARALQARLGEPGLVLVDVRGIDAWREASLPGAIHLNVYDYFIPQSDEAGITSLAAATEAAFEGLNLFEAKTVVFFEEDTGMISPRGLWFHEFLGLEGGLILDGGIKAWRAADLPVEPGNGPSAIIAPAEAGLQPRRPFRRELIASIDETAEAATVLDVRRRSEFTGDFVHPCCARAGRIPGCRHIFWEDLIEGGAYRSPAEVAVLAEKAGLRRNQTIITYCHRGARAATVLYALRQSGYEDVRIFVGSWHEWAGREELPAATGK
ncbi:sulfurtransferase [Bosea sp. (in: a-proteobacteria)]|jgi:thiosulfate/3-mercaptopyruvate sulfurtransferase|uniref:sulfurtransferase n=1 Tax=Bosea sp. (in: a-proteobacteria) TaxID=1871050 RepID=UPI003F6E7E8F